MGFPQVGVQATMLKPAYTSRPHQAGRISDISDCSCGVRPQERFFWETPLSKANINKTALYQCAEAVLS
tara:strand:+ start:706 stop:912 length:207 start_codon:yes stop_codon:yes gene_type:complete